MATVGAATQSTLAQIISLGADSGLTWPTDPFLETYDPSGLANDFGLAIHTPPGETGGAPGRLVGQSFRVPTATSVLSIFTEIAYQASTAGNYTIGIYEVDDTTIQGNQDPMLGTVLAQGTLLSGTGPCCPNAERIVRYHLSSPLALSPRTGNAGYALAFFGPDDTSHGTISLSARSTSSASFPPPSIDTVGGSEFGWETFPVGTGTNATRAAAFALVVPEPASLALLGLGGILMLRRRQSA
jgi:hypothetical protein